MSAGLVREEGSTLVGRSRELRAFEAMLDDVHGGSGGAALLVGEAGIGKTSMLSAVEASAARRGFQVLYGRAAEFERDLPYAASIDALAGLDHHLDVGGEPELRHVIHRRVSALLASASVQQPVVLCIDDAHWADSATIDLLAFLVHRAPAGRVLTIVSYRPHQTGSAISGALERAADASGAARIELSPLGVESAAELMPAGWSPAEIRELHASCGGNPFFLRHFAEHADASLVPRGEVARAVGALVASELEPLSTAARRLIDAAAIVGDPFDPSLAAAVAEPALSAADASQALDDLARADLLRPTDDPRAWAFRHPLVRSAVYRGAGAGWKLAAHGRAAAALREAGAGDLELAHHVERSAQSGDAEAIALLMRAGHQAGARSPSSAAHWFSVAWRLVPVERRAEPPHTDLLYALGVALTISGQGDRAMPIVEDAARAFAADDPLRPWFDLGFALIETTVGRMASARSRLLALSAQLGDDDTLERVTVAMSLAQVHLWAGQHDAAQHQATMARTGADALGGGPLLAAAEGISAWVAYVAGDLDEARDYQRSALARFDALDDATVSLFPIALAALLRTTWGLDRFAEASRLAARGLVVTRSGAWPILVVQFLAIQALCDLARGEVAAALDASDAAIEASALMEHDETRFWAAAVRATMLEPTASVATAAESAELAVRFAGQAGFRELAAHAGSVAAQALLALDRPGRAVDVVLHTHGGEELPWLIAGRRAGAYALLTRAELARGDEAAAAGWAARARSSAEITGLPLAQAHADVAQGQLYVAGGDAQRGAESLRAASEAMRAAGVILEGARTDLLWATALVAQGRRDDAIALLRRAESVFAGHGADRLQAEAVRMLRQQGRRVTKSGRAVAEGAGEPLTTRQREIAELAAAGASNPEIATRLFLSVKTIETHLSAVFVKLGVASRSELAEHLAAPSSVGKLSRTSPST